MQDIIWLMGVALIAFGVSTRFGYDMACIIVGGIFLTVTIIGAMRK